MNRRANLARSAPYAAASLLGGLVVLGGLALTDDLGGGTTQVVAGDAARLTTVEPKGVTPAPLDPAPQQGIEAWLRQAVHRAELNRACKHGDSLSPPSDVAQNRSLADQRLDDLAGGGWTIRMAVQPQRHPLGGKSPGGRPGSGRRSGRQ